MTEALSPNQKSAILRVLKNKALEREFYRRIKGAKWLPEIISSGLARPQDLPAPRPAPQEEGYVSIPVWHVTDYLVRVSAELAYPEDEPVARELLHFVRATSKYAKTSAVSNYRVWWQFAKILSNLPDAFITLEDVTALVDYWLDDPYERGLTAEEIADWVSKLLRNPSEHAASLAAELLRTLYRTRTVERKYGDTVRVEVIFRYRAWHAAKVTEKVAKAAGARLGTEGIRLFTDALLSALTQLGNDDWSSVWRPAIEDHEQNHGTDDAEDILVDATREALLGLVSAQCEKAIPVVSEFMSSGFLTLKRLGIFVIADQFDCLSGLQSAVAVAENISDKLRHEMWHFLSRHFARLSKASREHVRRGIESYATRESDEAVQVIEYRKAIWLSAIKDQDPELKLEFEKACYIAGGVPENPDFSSYMTTGWLTPESPYELSDLVRLDTSALIERLNSFVPSGGFDAPSKEGLAKALRQIVKSDPVRYAQDIGLFQRAHLPYLYELVEAYGELWREKAPVPWDQIWPNLLTFFRTIISDEASWKSAQGAGDSGPMLARWPWIVGSIARIIEDGVRDDGHAFAPQNNALALEVVRIALHRQAGEPVSESEDPITRAINTPRGQMIEALINLALRCCRLADAAKKSHESEWLSFEPDFDGELTATKHGNWEFATLVVRYLPNLLYLSRAWVDRNLQLIFPPIGHPNWYCAMYSYAFINSVYEPFYRLLRDRGDLLLVLDDEGRFERAKEQIVHQAAIAYLNGFETLDVPSDLISVILRRNDPKEFGDIIWIVWTVRESRDERVRGRVLILWRRMAELIDYASLSGKKLASKLCTWISFVDSIDAENLRLLERVLPYAEYDYNTGEVIEAIARISAAQPNESYQLWTILLSSGIKPDFPIEAVEEAFKNIRNNAHDGKSKAKVITDAYVEHGGEALERLRKIAAS